MFNQIMIACAMCIAQEPQETRDMYDMYMRINEQIEDILDQLEDIEVQLNYLRMRQSREKYEKSSWNPVGRDKPVYDVNQLYMVKGRDQRGNRVGAHDTISQVSDRTC